MLSYPVAFLTLIILSFLEIQSWLTISKLKEWAFSLQASRIFMTLGWSSCAKIASSVVECWSWNPFSEAILEKYTLKISATSLLSTLVSSPSRNIVWFPFRNFLSEKKGDIVRQKVLSCLAQLFSKYFAIDFLRNDTTWFRRRRFSSQYFCQIFGICFEPYSGYKAPCAIWSSYTSLIIVWQT